jgi:ribosome recycling factor
MNIIDETKKKMQDALNHLTEELKNVRTGRANPAMLDNVQVEVYGTQMRIKDLAVVSVPEPRQILITPFDKQTAGPIGKGIEKANLNVNPIIDGAQVRIVIPPMDDQQRKKMAQYCSQKKEAAKVSIRTIRRDSNDLVKRQKGEGLIPEDLEKRFEKEIQDLTDKFCKEVDEKTAAKEKEVLTI